MTFTLHWLPDAEVRFYEIKAAALKAQASRAKTRKTKASRQEGLYKQVVKCMTRLGSNPRHPSLRTHEFTSMQHPHEKGQKVFEAYVQNNTPAAFRFFWCYGPEKGEITIIAITPHP